MPNEHPTRRWALRLCGWLSQMAMIASSKPIPVTINTNETAEPISKYIYGQFIEHMGRCIYGGIWAEMLEDRKFYYPITADYHPYARDKDSKGSLFPVITASPWQIIGSESSVTMVKDNPFVGKHTPLIQPGGGIRQLDLTVVKDKQYVGYIYAKSADAPGELSVSLVWDNQPQANQTVKFTVSPEKYTKFSFQFTAGRNTTQARLEIRAAKVPVLIGTVSLMPADNIDGMRADTIALLKELNSPIYRWPGGNFVSGYDWRDGIGDRDRRPPRKNPAWTGIEHNDFGLHEFIHFCRLINTEPMITVNTGFGDAYSAAALVEYVNGSVDTPMGALRAQNGDVEPFNVRYWCVGNEMFGKWQLGHMSLEHYVLKHNWVVDKMREVDPNIIVIASGNAGPWSEGMLKHCSDHTNLIAEHFYCKEEPNLVKHTSLIPDQIKYKVSFHRQLRQKLDSLKSKDIRIAMTEWNYWYGPYLYGELGTRYYFKDAMGIARGLHEYFRNSDMIFMANYAQTVNVIGAIKTTDTAAEFETTGLVLKMYRNNFATIPVNIIGQTSPLDIVAAKSKDNRTITIGVVNPTQQQHTLVLNLEGAPPTGNGELWQIKSDDPMSYNEPGQKPRVIIEQDSISITNELSIYPLSINIYKLDLKSL